MTYEQHRTGANAALVALIVLIVQLFAGGEPPAWLASLAGASIGLVAIVTSWLFPRWQGNNKLTKHPAGWTGAVTVILSIVLPQIRPDMSAEEVTILVGGLISFVSVLTPAVDPELDRERIGF